jgi:hypothetical protein
MAIVKIEEVYLYSTDAFDNPEENISAVAFFENSGVPFTNMYYNANNDFDGMFSALNSWWVRGDEHSMPELHQFPFITYVEVHDNIPARLSPVKYVAGLEEIKKFPDFYFSIMHGR